jgi:hypothetical protein
MFSNASLEYLLHPYSIELLSIFLSDFLKPAAFRESIPLVEPYAAGIKGRYVRQCICNAFFDGALFEKIKQHLSQPFPCVVRMNKIRHFGGMRECRHWVVGVKHSETNNSTIPIPY